MPLTTLWDSAGEVSRTRERHLTLDELREILRGGPVRFVVARLGDPLCWIPEHERFSYWASIKRNIVSDLDGFSLDDFPGGVAVVASEWSSSAVTPIVLLETHH